MSKVFVFKRIGGGVGYRIAPEDATPDADEVAVDTPADQAHEWIKDKVWNDGTPRARSAAEELQQARDAQAQAIREAADAESEREFSALEMRGVSRRWSRPQVSLTPREQRVYEKEEARYARLVVLLAQIETASDVENVRSIEW